MNDNFWKKLSYFVGVAALGTIFGYAYQAAMLNLRDLDIWLHIGAGRFMTQMFTVPNADIFSAVMSGQPWIDHEWLFQILVYNLFNFWGPEALQLMQVSVALFTLALLAILGFDREKQIFVILFLFCAVVNFQTRFTMRPDLFSLLFFVYFLYSIGRYLNRKWIIPMLFGVQILWVNMHGFFFLGPLIVSLMLIGDLIKRVIPLPWGWNESGRLSKADLKTMRILFFALIGACFINPYFAKGAAYPFEILFSLSGDSNIFFDHIQELRPTFEWRTLLNMRDMGMFKGLIVLSFVSFVFNRRKLDVAVFMIWSVSLLFSLSAVRNISYFAFAAYWAFLVNIRSLNMDDLFPVVFKTPRLKYWTGIVAKILFVIFVFQRFEGLLSREYYDLEGQRWKNEYEGISSREYPHGAVDFLVNNGIQGKFFNDFNSGAYLIGRAYPNIQVFVDGRTELYGGAFFQDYLKIMRDGDMRVFEQCVERYGLTGVLIKTNHQKIPEQILKHLYTSPEWILVYLNYDGVVFLKDVEVNREWINRHAVDLTHWQVPKENLHEIGVHRAEPYRNVGRSLIFWAMGLDDAALAEADAAREISPFFVEPYQVAGRIYANRKQYEQAFLHLRMAAMMRRSDRQSQFDLAKIYYLLGKYQYAVQKFQDTLQRWPDEKKARLYLVMSQAQLGSCEDVLRQAEILLSDKVADQEMKDSFKKTVSILFGKKETSCGLRFCEVLRGAFQNDADFLNNLSQCEPVQTGDFHN